MRKNPKIFLLDILECIAKIEKYTKGATEQKFLGDDEMQDAVMKRLEIIGEASKNVPLKIRREHPEVPWKQMGGMRNALVHEYFGIVMRRIWSTTQKDLPKLKKQIEGILKSF